MKIVLTFIIMLLAVSQSFSQVDTKNIRMGNRLYEKEKYLDSEVKYRKALENNPNSVDAMFNLGDALYKQGKVEESAKVFNEALPLVNQNEQRKQLANTLYNLGNSLLKAKKFDESINAYKHSLRANPKDSDTKYNLAYAMQMKKQDQKNKDDKKKDEKNKDKNKPDDQKKKDPNKDKNDQDQQQKPQQKISKDDAERILNALQNKEREVQEKAKEQKGQPVKVKVQKNW